MKGNRVGGKEASSGSGRTKRTSGGASATGTRQTKDFTYKVLSTSGRTVTVSKTFRNKKDQFGRPRVVKTTMSTNEFNKLPKGK